MAFLAAFKGSSFPASGKTDILLRQELFQSSPYFIKSNYNSYLIVFILSLISREGDISLVLLQKDWSDLTKFLQLNFETTS